MTGVANGETPADQTPAAGEGTGESQTPANAGAESSNEQAASGQGAGGETPATSETDKLPPTVEALIKKLRKESADNDKAAKAALAKVKQFEDAQLSESERTQRALQEAQTQVSALQERVRMATLQAEATKAAASLNLVDVEAALALLPTVGTIEYDDNDVPTNVGELLATLAERKPFLVKTAEPPKPAQTGSATNPASNRNGGELTIDQIKKMSPQEVAARLPEVQAVLAAQGK